MDLPPFVSELFSDLGSLQPNPQKHARFVIERILRIGNLPAVRWMLKNYPRQQIREVALADRELTRRDINFWSVILSLPREKFKWISQF